VGHHDYVPPFSVQKVRGRWGIMVMCVHFLYKMLGEGGASSSCAQRSSNGLFLLAVANAGAFSRRVYCVLKGNELKILVSNKNLS
jgi:hypothetical protein